MEAITTTPANRTNQTGENPDISGVLGVLVGDVVPTGVSVAVPPLGVAVGVGVGVGVGVDRAVGGLLDGLVRVGDIAVVGLVVRELADLRGWLRGADATRSGDRRRERCRDEYGDSDRDCDCGWPAHCGFPRSKSTARTTSVLSSPPARGLCRPVPTPYRRLDGFVRSPFIRAGRLLDAMLRTIAAVALAAMLVVAGVAPAAAASGSDTDASATMTVTVTDDETLLVVSQDGEAAADATVTVSAVGDATFEGSATYQTDAEGQVRLPAPDEPTTVQVVVETDDARFEGVVTLRPAETGEYSVTVELEANASADGQTDTESDDGTSAAAESDGNANADEVWIKLVQLRVEIRAPLIRDGNQKISGHLMSDVQLMRELHLAFIALILPLLEPNAMPNLRVGVVGAGFIAHALLLSGDSCFNITFNRRRFTGLSSRCLFVIA